MSKKYKKHGYAERLKYMHMIENGFSIEYIQRTFYYHTKRLSEPDGYDDARAAICKIYDHHLVKATAWTML